MIEVLGTIGDDPVPLVGRADVAVWFGATGGDSFDAVREECDRTDRPMWWVDAPGGPNPTVVSTPGEFVAFARRDAVRSVVCCGADGVGDRVERFMAAVFRILQKEGDDDEVSAGDIRGRAIHRPVGAGNDPGLRTQGAG